jgi:hypothetical protein
MIWRHRLVITEEAHAQNLTVRKAHSEPLKQSQGDCTPGRLDLSDGHGFEWALEGIRGRQGDRSIYFIIFLPGQRQPPPVLVFHPRMFAPGCDQV